MCRWVLGSEGHSPRQGSWETKGDYEDVGSHLKSSLENRMRRSGVREDMCFYFTILM